ncbi:protein FAM166A-like [Acipenser ruthenus]|uniref:protein FAM166A-like n=1 Tax=Acipenser ruthenus TaxID=7906 RepID=UPI002741A8B5|nr:protein FAM166A-like [Acipenser ruthenus]
MGTRRNSLFPPDPYYIPGYGGYCPQLLFQFGHTYGTTTFNLLTNPDVRHSDRSVLVPLKIADCTGRLSNVTLPPLMKPKSGETIPPESVPLSQDPNGSRFSIKTPMARENFQNQRQEPLSSWNRPDPKRDHHRHETWEGAGTSFFSRSAPLHPAPHPPTWSSPGSDEWDPLPSARDKDTQRKVISGYTGFIPTVRWSLAKNYCSAVREAGSNEECNQYLLRNPGRAQEEKTRSPVKELYRRSGMLPRYTGFIPGVRYKHGLTFGQSSRESYWDHHNPDQ